MPKQLLLISLLLAACQAPPAAPDHRVLNPEPHPVSVRVPAQPPVPQGQLRSRKQRLELELQYQQPGFRTQAFGCGEVAFAQIEAFGPGFASIYANGSDAQQMLPTVNCQISGAIDNVPYGTVLVRVRLFDAQRQLLKGSELTIATRLGSESQQVELSYRQSNVAQVVQQLMQSGYAAEFLLNTLDLDALQGFFDTLTGVAGTFPNYTYTLAPQQVAISAVVQQLLANNGNIAALNTADPAFQLQLGQLQLTLAGVLPGQAVSLSVDDALSDNLSPSSNGPQLLTGLVPGSWTLRLSGAGYLAQVHPFEVTAGQTLDLGTLIVSPLPVQLDGLSAAQGTVGQTLTLNGARFSPVAANNQVYFGNTPATVNSVNPEGTQLEVVVPAVAGTQAVRVAVGEQQSETHNFSVVPVIDSLSVNSGSTATQLTITGSGFSPVASENTVRLGDIEASVLSVNGAGSVLSVAVPERPAGSAPVSVQVGSQTSGSSTFNVLPYLAAVTTQATADGKAVLVQQQVVTLTGSNFDPVAANNSVRFGSNTVQVASASATELTVLAPALNTGDVTLSVLVNGQTSGTITATAPAGQLSINNGGFY